MKIADFLQENSNKERSEEELIDEVLLYFRENPESSFNDVDKISKHIGISNSKLQELQFELCKALCSKIGRHVKHGTEKVDKKEYALGLSVEREHTDNEYIARLITLDHLAELPDYYSRLEKMEDTK